MPSDGPNNTFLKPLPMVHCAPGCPHDDKIATVMGVHIRKHSFKDCKKDYLVYLCSPSQSIWVQVIVSITIPASCCCKSWQVAGDSSG